MDPPAPEVRTAVLHTEVSERIADPKKMSDLDLTCRVIACLELPTFLGLFGLGYRYGTGITFFYTLLNFLHFFSTEPLGSRLRSII